MRKYMKKPVAVRAVQWFPPDDKRHDAEGTPIASGLTGIGLGSVFVNTHTTKYELNTTIRRGRCVLVPGCWIVHELRDPHTVSEELFAATYEEVDDG